MLEQSRGALIYALMFREDVLLYPVNPKQLASYRDSYHGGGKNDPTDAMYLARMLRERITTLKAWQPDDKNTRLIANLSQQRRKIVDGQTKLRQQLSRPSQVAWARTEREAETWPARPTLGGRANRLVAQPLPPHSGAMGKEGRKLRSLVASRLRSYPAPEFLRFWDRY